MKAGAFTLRHSRPSKDTTLPEPGPATRHGGANPGRAKWGRRWFTPKRSPSPPPLGAEDISQRILAIRGHRVMLDADLAEPYGMTSEALNQAIKRNADRFPEDFMFQLSPDEATALRSQNATLKIQILL